MHTGGSDMRKRITVLWLAVALLAVFAGVFVSRDWLIAQVQSLLA